MIMRGNQQLTLIYAQNQSFLPSAQDDQLVAAESSVTRMQTLQQQLQLILSRTRRTNNPPIRAPPRSQRLKMSNIASPVYQSLHQHHGTTMSSLKAPSPLGIGSCRLERSRGD